MGPPSCVGAAAPGAAAPSGGFSEESHAAAIDVVSQVIDFREAAAFGMTVDAVEELKVDVVNRVARRIAIDQVKRRAANALDRG